MVVCFYSYLRKLKVLISAHGLRYVCLELQKIIVKLLNAKMMFDTSDLWRWVSNSNTQNLKATVSLALFGLRRTTTALSLL